MKDNNDLLLQIYIFLFILLFAIASAIAIKYNKLKKNCKTFISKPAWPYSSIPVYKNINEALNSCSVGDRFFLMDGADFLMYKVEFTVNYYVFLARIKRI